jgi:hypothetical protein
VPGRGPVLARQLNSYQYPPSRTPINPVLADPVWCPLSGQEGNYRPESRVDLIIARGQSSWLLCVICATRQPLWRSLPASRERSAQISWGMQAFRLRWSAIRTWWPPSRMRQRPKWSSYWGLDVPDDNLANLKRLARGEMDRTNLAKAGLFSRDDGLRRAPNSGPVCGLLKETNPR